MVVDVVAVWVVQVPAVQEVGVAGVRHRLVLAVVVVRVARFHIVVAAGAHRWAHVVGRELVVVDVVAVRMVQVSVVQVVDVVVVSHRRVAAAVGVGVVVLVVNDVVGHDA